MPFYVDNYKVVNDPYNWENKAVKYWMGKTIDSLDE